MDEPHNTELGPGRLEAGEPSTDPAPKSDEEPEGYEKPARGGWGEFDIDALAIRYENRTAQDTVRRIERGYFLLAPDFQRNFLWKDNQQSRLIESILLRIPIPPIYVSEDTEGRLAIVDGRQRLTAIMRFLKGELALDLPERENLHGKTFNELPPRLQMRVEDYQLYFYIIEASVPEKALLDIFERVNSGEPLTRQQMRNALYNGIATRFLKEEASTDLFKEATGKSLSSDFNVNRMLDREFVNRFCAFALLDLSEYRGEMDEWLGRALKVMNKSKSEDLDALSTQFRAGLAHNYLIFGKHAFRKHRSADQARSVINASLYDVMMYTLSRRTHEEIVAKREAVREAFYRLMEDVEFNKAITYGPNSANMVRCRFKTAQQEIGGVFDVHAD